MTEREDALDEGLRRRVGELYGSEPARGLDSAAQARVLLSATREAQRLAQVRSWRRAAVRVAAACAAAAGLLLVLRGWGPLATPSSPLSAAATPATCKLPARSSGLSFETLPDARQRLVLDGFGVLWGAPGSQLRVQSAGACELLIALDHGELAGDLHSLRPARLVIRTGSADVVITGTRFAVRADDSFEVLLAKGTVDVVLPDARALHMRPGTRLHKASGPSVQMAALSSADGSRLDALLAAVLQPSAAVTPAAATPSAVAEPARAAAKKPPVSAARSSLQLLEAAESARRAGKSAEARKLYRDAGSCNDDNAEVALLRWVRLELAEKDAAAASLVLARHAQAFVHGRLGAEASWLQVQVFLAQQKPTLAREAAGKLIATYSDTPQAEAARRWLRSAP